MIKAVFFDIDNTLYDFDICLECGMKVLRDYAERHLAMTGAEFECAYWEAFRYFEDKLGRDNATIHNLWIRIQHILERRGLPYDPHVMAMPELFWQAVLERMHPEPYLAETLRFLREKGLKIGIGTNMTSAVQFKKLTRLAVLPFVDMMVTSEEALSEKPNSGFFRLCLEKAGEIAGAEAGECLFIGDTFGHDITGAALHGMIPIWYNPKQREKPPGKETGWEGLLEITSFWKNRAEVDAVLTRAAGRPFIADLL